MNDPTFTMKPRIAPSLPGNVMSARCPIAMAMPTPGASTPEAAPPATAPPEPTLTTMPPVSSLQIIDPYGPKPKTPYKQSPPPPSGSSPPPRGAELYGAELYCCPSILTSLRHQAPPHQAPAPRKGWIPQAQALRSRDGRRRARRLLPTSARRWTCWRLRSQTTPTSRARCLRAGRRTAGPGLPAPR